MKDLVVFGAGDMAEIALTYFTHDSDYRVVGFTVDARYASAPEFLGLPLVPFESVETRFPPDDHSMFVAVGFKNLNRARADAVERCKAKGYSLASYISSKATLCEPCSVGENCLVLENNVVQPFVRIGDDSFLWSGNHIGHHSVVEDHCFISSHVVVSGRVRIGAYSFLGVNSSVADGVTVGRDCLIGAGAVILADAKDGSLYSVEGTPVSPIPARRAARLL